MLGVVGQSLPRVVELLRLTTEPTRHAFATTSKIAFPTDRERRLVGAPLVHDRLREGEPMAAITKGVRPTEARSPYERIADVMLLAIIFFVLAVVVQNHRGPDGRRLGHVGRLEGPRVVAAALPADLHLVPGDRAGDLLELLPAADRRDALGPRPDARRLASLVHGTHWWTGFPADAGVGRDADSRARSSSTASSS